MINNIVLEKNGYKIRHSLKGEYFLLTYYDKTDNEEMKIYVAHWNDTENMRELQGTFNEFVYGRATKEQRAETKETLENYIKNYRLNPIPLN